MIYDRHPEQQSKWSKAFWVRGYFVATVGNITELLVRFSKPLLEVGIGEWENVNCTIGDV